jgi:hypothetical protein
MLLAIKMLITYKHIKKYRTKAASHFFCLYVCRVRESSQNMITHIIYFIFEIPPQKGLYFHIFVINGETDLKKVE